MFATNTEQNIIHITFSNVNEKKVIDVKPKMYNLNVMNKCPIFIYFPEYGFKIKDNSDKYLEVASKDMQHIAVIILEKKKNYLQSLDSKLILEKDLVNKNQYELEANNINLKNLKDEIVNIESFLLQKRNEEKRLKDKNSIEKKILKDSIYSMGKIRSY